MNRQPSNDWDWRGEQLLAKPPAEPEHVFVGYGCKWEPTPLGAKLIKFNGTVMAEVYNKMVLVDRAPWQGDYYVGGKIQFTDSYKSMEYAKKAMENILHNFEGKT